jgi:hypothetical protein
MKTPSQPAPSEYVVLTDNYIVEGVQYPRGTPILRGLVAPHHLRDLEVRQGAPRKVSAGGVANFVPGVSYPIGPDGAPVRTAETDAAELQARQAQREIEEENWRASGLRYTDPETGEIHEPKSEELR